MPHALIIGASRGLGLGLVREFASRGWDVTGTVRDGAAEAAVRDAGGTPARAEVTDEASLAALHAATPGELDLLFVNAGISGPKHQDAGQTTPEEAGTLFLTNAVAPVAIARRFLDRLAPGAVVAFMSSRMGSVALNDNGSLELYRASKAALNSLTQSFVAKLDRDLTVLTLHPGWVQTDMGGQGADLDVPTSVRGLADVVEARRGTPGAAFLDYSGATLAW